MRKNKRKNIRLMPLPADLLHTSQRLDSLERRVEELEKARETDPETVSMSRLLQEGIDSIVGYQWPPTKGGNT